MTDLYMAFGCQGKNDFIRSDILKLSELISQKAFSFNPSQGRAPLVLKG
jgi:hypothetical protein